MEEGKINWQRLMSAITYYSDCGYKFIDLNWCVDESTSAITKPLSNKDFFINDKVLVASGEQSFLQMIIDGNLPKGKYCGITPCFRDDKPDELHSNYFMKVELIDTLEANKQSLDKMIACANSFFNNFIQTKIIQTHDEMYDIESLLHIELGSYGIRHYNDIVWVFGTGLAEPRLSKAINLI